MYMCLSIYIYVVSKTVERKMTVKAEKSMAEGVREEGVVGVGLNQHFVLVHGICGGSWCWYKIRCLMENSGYKVSCIDLKSAGIDQSDADSVLSFDDYNKPLMDFMSALPENEQVVKLVPPAPFLMSLSPPYVIWDMCCGIRTHISHVVAIGYIGGAQRWRLEHYSGLSQVCK